MKFATTFATKMIELKLEDLTFGNDWVPLIFEIKTTKDFRGNLVFNKQQIKKYATPFNIMGQNTLCQLLCLLPYNVGQIGFDLVQNTRTFLYTSIPGPMNGFRWNGMQTKGIMPIVPLTGEASFSIMYVSVDNVILIGLFCDLHYMENPDLFMQILDRKMIEFSAQADNIQNGQVENMQKDNNAKKEENLSKM